MKMPKVLSQKSSLLFRKLPHDSINKAVHYVRARHNYMPILYHSETDSLHIGLDKTEDILVLFFNPIKTPKTVTDILILCTEVWEGGLRSQYKRPPRLEYVQPYCMNVDIEEIAKLPAVKHTGDIYADTLLRVIFDRNHTLDVIDWYINSPQGVNLLKEV